MSTSPLPERPDLAQLRRVAKELRDATNAGDRDAAARVVRHLPAHRFPPLRLTAAQLVVAREHGFPSWARLRAEVEARTLDLAQRVDAFLEASVEGRPRTAARLLADEPAIASFDVSTAAVLGEAAHLRRLLEHDPGAAVRSDHRRAWPPLLYVCHSRWHQIDPGRAHGMLEVARLLLDAGASPDTKHGRPRHGFRSALFGAAGIANHPALARLLLERGADPDDDESVYHSVFHRDHECLRLLVGHGARVRGTNALPALIGQDDAEGVRLLVAAGADPGRPFPRDSAPVGQLPDMSHNPLPAAAQRDSAAVVEALLEAGADPDAPCRDGRSPLRAAVRRGRPDVAEVLLRHGARDDADEVDRFIGACMRGDRAGADLRVLARLSEEDLAVLVDAAESASVEVVGLMLELGFPADVRRRGDGGAALHAAAYSGRSDVVRLLIAHGADVDRRDLQWDSTPLCWATVGSGERESGDWDGVIQALLAAGASATAAVVPGKPPSEDVAELLEALGIAGEEAPEERPAEDPAVLADIGRKLRAAFESGDLDLFGSLLHPDVRWGGGPGGCTSREQVLDWYRVLHDRRGPARVTEVMVRGDRVVLGLAGAPFQVFRVSGGSIVRVSGAEDREEALAG